MHIAHCTLHIAHYGAAPVPVSTAVQGTQACIKFQREHELKADGIVGKITWDTTFAYQNKS